MGIFIFGVMTIRYNGIRYNGHKSGKGYSLSSLVCSLEAWEVLNYVLRGKALKTPTCSHEHNTFLDSTDDIVYLLFRIIPLGDIAADGVVKIFLHVNKNQMHFQF